jgi:hypothetical protein
MPKVKVNNITMNYDQQGTDDPLILIPYLTADCACYAFQVAEYAKHFTCMSIDLRGTGVSDKPEGLYSAEFLADDVAAFMGELGIAKAHVFGLFLALRDTVIPMVSRLAPFQHAFVQRLSELGIAYQPKHNSLV